MRSKLTLCGTAAAIGITCFGWAAPSHAEDHQVYLRADAGYSMSSSTSGDIFNGTGFGQNLGDAPVFDAGIGMTFGEVGSGINLRADAVLGFRQSRRANHSAPNATSTITLATTSDVDTFTTLGTVYADFDMDSALKPYVGLGLGIANNTVHPLSYTSNGAAFATEVGGSSLNFAWQATAGIGYPLSQSATLDIAYHYLDAGRVRSSGTITLVSNGSTSTQPPLQSGLAAHEVTLGVRFTF